MLWIEVEAGLAFGFNEDCPTVVVILHHLDVVNGYLAFLTDGFCELGGLLFVAHRGILDFLASLGFGDNIEGGVDTDSDIVKIARVFLHGLRPLGNECLTFGRETGGHAHLLHLDGRGKFYDETFSVDLVLLGHLAT